MAGHKYWRVINITRRTTASNERSVAELDFINTENVATSNTAKAFSKNSLNSSYTPDKAFDKTASTFAHIGGDYSTNTLAQTWYIGYQFDTPVTVTQIKLQMRQDMTSSMGQEWQTANVEYSDDGTNWTLYGKIEPKIASMDLALKTVDIILVSKVTGKSLQDNAKPSRFVLIHDWATGDFIQKIVPLPDGTWTYTQLGNAPVLVTHVGEDGYKPQADGGVVPVAVA